MFYLHKALRRMDGTNSPPGFPQTRRSVLAKDKVTEPTSIVHILCRTWSGRPRNAEEASPSRIYTAGVVGTGTGTAARTTVTDGAVTTAQRLSAERLSAED